MTKSFLLIFIFSFLFSYGQIEEELIILAQKEGLEIVSEDKFPKVNPYGADGSPIIYDFVNDEILQNSVLFLCRKNISNEIYSNEIINLIANYDYFHFFAIKRKGKWVKKSIIQNIGLKGMNVIKNNCEVNLSHFYKLDKDSNFIEQDSLRGPNKNFNLKGSGILIEADSSTIILYYYNNNWFFNLDVDW